MLPLASSLNQNFDGEGLKSSSFFFIRLIDLKHDILYNGQFCGQKMTNNLIFCPTSGQNLDQIVLRRGFWHPNTLGEYVISINNEKESHDVTTHIQHVTSYITLYKTGYYHIYINNTIEKHSSISMRQFI